MQAAAVELCDLVHQFVSSSLSTLTSAPHWLYWVIRVLAGSYVAENLFFQF
ncbi:hypothetical protein Syun_030542 [Stephania yunnanensis]|uniref:Uncharacterized protein n=1 Tax=Stephania yunnanensis TaxID=152371 RepID=A0AAP0HBZ7_9MAGN